jgi:hypothetical protein
MPIWLYGKRFVIVMQENDPALKDKIKELFWILLTQCAKERPYSRIFFWALLGISGFLFFICFLDNVFKALCGISLISMLASFVDRIGSYALCS